MADERTSPPQVALSSTQALVRSAPVFVVLLLIGGIYSILPERFLLGPRWLTVGGIVLFVAVLMVAISVEHFQMGRAASILLLGVVTLAEAVSVSALVFSIITASNGTNKASHDQTLMFLRDAVLIWLVNILTFSFWYWEIDGGGPAQRHHHGYDSSDLIFPQRSEDSLKDQAWIPHFVDYLFLAFNTSTAFSPTDTLILSVRAKLLMMAQSLISLIILAIIVARALNTL